MNSGLLAPGMSVCANGRCEFRSCQFPGEENDKLFTAFYKDEAASPCTDGKRRYGAWPGKHRWASAAGHTSPLNNPRRSFRLAKGIPVRQKVIFPTSCKR